jgi:hypothetical protein
MDNCSLYQEIRMPRAIVVFLLFFMALCGVLPFTAGCGGSGGSGGRDSNQTLTGRATVNIRWPERTRLIPFASESVRIQITRDGVGLGESLMVRPAAGGQTSATFDTLPLGNVVVTATALPKSDGSGTAQAQAQVTATVVADAINPVSITMASTITRLEATPTPLRLAANQTAPVVATARNAEGEAVLIAPATLIWRSLDTSVATVNSDGVVRGITTGTTTIEVKETESGTTATLTVIGLPTSSGGVVCNPDSGHCYEQITVVKDKTAFANLVAEALGRTYQGLKGHLATINTTAENEFIRHSFTVTGCTLGAFQDRTSPDYREPRGGWRWVTDEPFIVAPWNAGGPNDVSGDADFIHLLSNDNWEDCFDGDWTSYLVEYEPGVVRGGAGGLVLYEGFNYPAGSLLRDQNGGIGWARAWNEYGQGNTASLIVANSLTFGNLKTAGGAVQFTSQNPIGHARIPLKQIGVDGTVLYFSILVRPLTVTGGSPDSYFGMGFSDMGFGKPGRTDVYSIEKPSFNFSKTSVQAKANETVFLVGRVTFRAGNDLVEFWVNPTPGQPLPAPMATKSDVNVSLPGDIGIGGSVRCLFDEYRIGTTWESVSPVGP